MTPLKALSHLPDLDGRRFGLIEIGTKGVETIRNEYRTLLDIAAAVCGVTPEALTIEMLAALDLSAVRARQNP